MSDVLYTGNKAAGEFHMQAAVQFQDDTIKYYSEYSYGKGKISGAVYGVEPGEQINAYFGE